MWKKIVIHHSASPSQLWRSGKWVKVGRDIINEWHVRRGFGQIGYHFLVQDDGTIEAGRPINMAGAHCNASRRNLMGLGVVLVGNFQERSVPDRQLQASVRLCQKLITLFKLNGSWDIELHREVPGAKTLCPGKHFPREKFIKLLAEPLKISLPASLSYISGVK